MTFNKIIYPQLNFELNNEGKKKNNCFFSKNPPGQKIPYLGIVDPCIKISRRSSSFLETEKNLSLSLRSYRIHRAVNRSKKSPLTPHRGGERGRRGGTVDRATRSRIINRAFKSESIRRATLTERLIREWLKRWRGKGPPSTTRST